MKFVARLSKGEQNSKNFLYLGQQSLKSCYTWNVPGISLVTMIKLPKKMPGPMLCDDKVKSCYGLFVWKLIPQIWRHWFIGDLKSIEEITYGKITLHLPKPSFIDITYQKKEFDDLVKSHSLPNIAKGCNT